MTPYKPIASPDLDVSIADVFALLLTVMTVVFMMTKGGGREVQPVRPELAPAAALPADPALDAAQAATARLREAGGTVLRSAVPREVVVVLQWDEAMDKANSGSGRTFRRETLDRLEKFLFFSGAIERAIVFRPGHPELLELLPVDLAGARLSERLEVLRSPSGPATKAVPPAEWFDWASDYAGSDPTRTKLANFLRTARHPLLLVACREPEQPGGWSAVPTKLFAECETIVHILRPAPKAASAEGGVEVTQWATELSYRCLDPGVTVVSDSLQ